MAFITGPALPPAAAATPRTRWTCAASAHRPSRRALLTSAAASAASLLAASVRPAPASAAAGSQNLESAFSKFLFPKKGFNAPDTLQPSPSVVDQQVLSSKEAQAALQKIRSYAEQIGELYESFKSDPQIELAAPVRDMVSISDLRNALNIVNEAVDEESQIQTDKVVRGIIQDIGELETAAYVKKGSARTPKKIDRTTDWFEKITSDFSRLLAFYS